MINLYSVPIKLIKEFKPYYLNSLLFKIVFKIYKLKYFVIIIFFVEFGHTQPDNKTRRR